MAEAPILTAPVSVGDKIYILPEHRGMFQIDAETGIEQWRSPHVARFIAASPNRLYGTDRIGNLVILDRDTGSLVGALALLALFAASGRWAQGLCGTSNEGVSSEYEDN